MIVIDTNVISEIAKAVPDANVADWLRRADPAELYLCAPVVAELAYGGQRIRLRDGSSRFLEALDGLLAGQFNNRVLPFDQGAALKFGEIRAARESSGRPISVMDAMIAAICAAHGATLATRNVPDFNLLEIGVVNPFEALR
ncbi:MAG: VapC toxin family PIN domain ribonuclease [Ahrensia sp.]|nr:VapC toxin family PIN domain ribonuclease [Ahrensia sp.]